jgi:predicted TIM-barrel fold metal-dependent hydrolase
MEEILEPELLICDPHHHLWNEPHANYMHPYMVEDLMADVHSGHRIDKTVFIECRSGYLNDGPEALRPLGEPAFVVAAEPSGFVAGIVGHIDLRIEDLDQALASLAEAGAGRLRGIRHITAFDPSPDIVLNRPGPPGLFAEPAFRRGLTMLGRAGLSFDAWLHHPQIPTLTELARACPETTLILNHLGGRLGIGPYAAQRADVHSRWRSALSELASFDNVLLKLGGIGMPTFGQLWHQQPDGATSEQIAAVYGEDMQWCIEQFGVDRCMFESNFPVDKVSFSYATVWNAFKRIAAGASAAEKQALFHDTAARAYRI